MQTPRGITLIVSRTGGKRCSFIFMCNSSIQKSELFSWNDGIEAREWEFEMAVRRIMMMKDKMREQLCKI